MKGAARIAFFLFLLCCSLNAKSQTLLTHRDVNKVMEELFDYHIDKKEISPLLIQRSLKIYLNGFDTRRAYLLKGETDSYINPKESFLSQAMRDYKTDHFAVYYSLNEKIQKGILRAREWRYEWENDPLHLIEDAKNFTSHREEEEIPFPTTLQELKKRHRDEFVKLIRVHLEEIGHEDVKGKEGRLIALCEKQLSLSENDFLGLNDEGQKCSQDEFEHHVILRTIKSLAHSLDAHTAYYSPEEAYAMKVQLEKGMCGIGVVLHEGLEGVIIADVIKGGPAEKGGRLIAGDCIVEVDGELVKDYSFHKVLDILRGEEGSKTVLGIRRKEQFSRVELTREHMTLDEKRVDISSEPFGDGVIGKITLYSFYEGDDGISSEKDLRKAIDQLREKGPLYGLVLDMRDNSGGFLSQSVRVSGLFISGGVVVISKYSDGSMKYYRAVDGRRFYDGPLVVLVSKGSASATEIVAQTLQDYGVGVVVGDDQTYGKGTIQHQTVTSEKSNSFFKVTIGRYYTVSGKSTQIDGVKSDIVVPTSLNGEKVGEGYLDFPLPSDRVTPAFVDSLADLDPYAKKWFYKYYLPVVQQKVSNWTALLSKLRENSRLRLNENKNYQVFLKKMKKEKLEERENFGSNDLQMEESVNIIRDMIFMKATLQPFGQPSG